MQRIALVFAAASSLALLAGASATASSDAVLFDGGDHAILTGRYSVYARFQGNLQRLLDGCGQGAPAVVPAGEEPSGRLGPETRAGIERALTCRELSGVPADSPARQGAITESVWRAVMGEPLPNVKDRAEALVLAFEATDFGEPPEWNFCADSRGEGSTKPRSPSVCRDSSDPCSYLTWGPRGATAGAGREIQLTLWLAWRASPDLVEQAFGAEFPALRRLFRLKSAERDSCRRDTPVGRFMCGIWIDPARRRIWDKALAKLGRAEVVRSAYARLYASSDYDGDKLKGFASLWDQLGLKVNELDYAFFLDRITHLGAPPEDEDATARAMARCLRGERSAFILNAAARRCLSRLQPHPRQAEYRLGRDVAYFVHAYPPDSLSRKEVDAWENYLPISAERAFGLSETRRVDIDALRASRGALQLPTPDVATLTREESAACPAVVLAPRAQR
jgi:hypothetical protein